MVPHANEPAEIVSYERRFITFIRSINVVSRMEPKNKYLYRIMDGVPFKDLETALLMAQIDCVEGQNDNQNLKS